MPEPNRPALNTSTIRALAQLGVVELAIALHGLTDQVPKLEGRNNAERASKAAFALHAYAALDGVDLSASPALVEEMLIDLLADLLHHAQREDIDVEEVLAMAREHHRSETEGPGPDGL